MRRMLLFLLLAAVPLSTFAQSSENKRLRDIDSQIRRASYDINAIMAAPDKAIPSDLLDKAVCVGIIPSELKFAFMFGGSYGRGVLVCRKNGTGEWGEPAMFTLGGGSFGLQIGGAESSVIFLVMNAKGARELTTSNAKIGVDVTGAAGPVGRHLAASTTGQMGAEILTYSRSHGIFAGISLDGAVIKQDLEDDRALYGANATPKDILIRQTVTKRPGARVLNRTLDKYSPHGGQPITL